MTIQERNRIIEDNRFLVLFIVKRFWRSFGTNLHNLEFDDLVQEGCIALMNAVPKFDVAKSQFSTYASRVIWNRIHDVAFSGGLIRVNPRVRAESFRKQLGLPAKKKFSDEALGKAQQSLKFEAISEEAPGAEDPLQVAIASEALRLALIRIARLSPLERNTILNYFGLLGRLPQSLATIGRSRGVSKQAMEWVCKRALKRLRK